MAGVKTGQIKERDYGVVVRSDDGTRTFFSPSDYALGALILESQDALKRRLRANARRDGLNFHEVQSEFEKGVRRKEKTRNLFVYAGRNALRNVRVYGRTVVGKIRSKSRDRFYEAKIEIPDRGLSLPGNLDCECTTNFWENDVKVRNASCHHSAALHTALYVDNKLRRASEKNYTGLPPRQRFETAMPFSFFDTAEGDSLLTDIITGIYVEGFSQYDVDRDVLNNPRTYSALLRELIRDEADTAQFRVMRQREVEMNPEKLSETERRRYASIKALEARLHTIFEDHNYFRSGYVLEFKGTKFETIAIRYVSRKNRSLVYNLCMRGDMPPLLVKKNMMDKIPYIMVSDDTRVDHPFARVGERYATIDDATRREALAEVIVPGFASSSGKMSDIFVPENLVQEYRGLLRSHGKEAA